MGAGRDVTGFFGQAKRSELLRCDSLHVGGLFNVWFNHTVRELCNPHVEAELI